MIVEYNNTVCVEAGWLYSENGIMPEGTYKSVTQRAKHNLLKHKEWNVIRRPAYKTSALIEYKSIPAKYKEQIVQKLGYNPEEQKRYLHFRKFLVPIRSAIEFYGTYKLPEGSYLKTEVAKEYCTNAMFLTACHQVSITTAALRRAILTKRTGIWQALSDIVNNLRDEYNHTLPANYLRLKEKTKTYMHEGFTSLIHRGYGNNNSRVVTEKLEDLFLAIYCMPNKPYGNMVLDVYLQFLSGSIELLDIKTGEIFNRTDFFDNTGKPIVVSEATVWNYINNPKNRAIVDAIRNDYHYFNNIHRPHFHRHSPKYSFSLISLDDRDMPQNKAVKAYYAYEVKSRCLIGKAYSRDKNKELFIDCMRDMFRFINAESCGFPMELQVEHHLVNKFKDDLMKAGVVFPFIRWCNPGNSQEKIAEGFIKQKKYGFEKRYNDGIGRWNLSEANRPKQNKVWTDEEGMVIKEKQYSFEEVVATDLEIIEKYNNSLHPDQKSYKGLTRLQVLRANINPDLPVYEPALVARFLGDKTQTSIHRNQYVRVQYAKYQLPEFEVMKNLEPNNYTVDAYYLPSDNIEKVYIYQNDSFIAECKKINTFNIATSEQTDDDLNNITEQAKYVSNFDSEIKKSKKETPKIEIIKNDFNEIETTIKSAIHSTIIVEDNTDDWSDYSYSKDYAIDSV